MKVIIKLVSKEIKQKSIQFPLDHQKYKHNLGSQLN